MFSGFVFNNNKEIKAVTEKIQDKLKIQKYLDGSMLINIPSMLGPNAFTTYTMNMNPPKALPRCLVFLARRLFVEGQKMALTTAIKMYSTNRINEESIT